MQLGPTTRQLSQFEPSWQSSTTQPLTHSSLPPRWEAKEKKKVNIKAAWVKIGQLYWNTTKRERNNSDTEITVIKEG